MAINRPEIKNYMVQMAQFLDEVLFKNSYVGFVVINTISIYKYLDVQV